MKSVQSPFVANLHAKTEAEHFALTNNEDRIQDWLLLLLRFAITRDQRDCASTLQRADDIDASGLCWRPSGPTFFVRTTQEICAAITACDDPEQLTVLKKHMSRIEEPRLRRALEAALCLDNSSQLEPIRSRRKGQVVDLWKGLSSP